MTNKTEAWREACQKLLNDGLLFDISTPFGWSKRDKSSLCFTNYPVSDFCIAQQPIPDRPDWREWCMKMQDVGVEFEINICMTDGKWAAQNSLFDFCQHPKNYRIAKQPIPESIEDLIMQEKPEPKEEIPHREQKRQWCQDFLKYLSGEEMAQWEQKADNSDEWKLILPADHYPWWYRGYEYRRKPNVKKVTYWHCVVRYSTDEVDLIYNFVSMSDLERDIECVKESYTCATFTQITETTVEVETPE